MAAVFFDVDGTLVRWPVDYHEDILAPAFERVIGDTRADWLDRYDDRFFEHFGAFAEDPYRQAFADVCDRFDLDADPELLAETLVEREFTAVEPVAGVEAVLSALTERHTLGVLTNGVPRVQFGKLRHTGLAGYFDVTVASHGDGVRALKPDAAIYAAARDRADADTYVMVGDDSEADVDGARCNGFVPVHVDDSADELSAPNFRTLATLL